MPNGISLRLLTQLSIAYGNALAKSRLPPQLPEVRHASDLPLVRRRDTNLPLP
jgi:hypothetical protein